MTTKEKRNILNYLKLCFPLCGTNIQRMEDLNELIDKLKKEIQEEEEIEKFYNQEEE